MPAAVGGCVGLDGRGRSLLLVPGAETSDCAEEVAAMKCAECTSTDVAARGLCDTCYHAAQRLGVLEDYPRQRLAYTPELRADVVALRRLGWSMVEIGKLMRWKVAAVRRVCRLEGVGGRMAR